LCFHEYTHVKCKDESHLLVKLLSSSVRVRLRFYPFEYLSVMSKELEKATSCCILQKRIMVSVTEMSSEDRIGRLNIAKPSTNPDIISKYVEAVNQFVELHKGSSALTFTDGSVSSGSVGCGACAAVLYPLLDSEETMISTQAVGKKVSSLTV